MIEYSYNIYSMDSYPSYENYENVVFRVVYQIVARSGDFMAANTTDINLEYQPGSTFIAYADLTKDIVVGWVENTLGQQTVNKIKAELKRALEQQMYPNTQSLPLPFEN